MGKFACYVVLKGRKTGVYSTWEECKAQVDHFSGASYKGCYSEEEAIEALTRVGVVGGRIRTTTEILKELKRPEVSEQSSPPSTVVSPPSAPIKVDDWMSVKDLIRLLLVALIALVVVVISVVVKMYLL